LRQSDRIYLACLIVSITVATAVAAQRVTRETQYRRAKFPGLSVSVPKTEIVAGDPVDISVVKTVSMPPYSTEMPITYTIVVTNAGPDVASLVTVADSLPSGTTFISASSTQGTCQVNQEFVLPPAFSVDCAVGTLAPAAPATIVVLLRLPSTPGSITNIASARSSNPETNPANNMSAVTVDVAPTIPTLSPSMLLVLSLTVVIVGTVQLRR
jgi:uncharacterized repeat protein (TIGR01451 family)